jgi:hypothetical protein
MQTEKIAHAATKLAAALTAIATDLMAGDATQACPAAQPVAAAQLNPAPRGPNANTMVQVPAGDLWRLANRARKMIRLAREGKVPNQQTRAPLCKALKTLKAQGVLKKPYNID